MISELADQYLAAQLAGDRRRAIHVLLDDGLAQGIPVPDLYLGVVQAAQYRIGTLWQLNQVSVAQEHVATAISQLALAELYRVLPRHAPNGKVVVVACVEGELHDLGARMVADFLEMVGFDVRYVGANLPTDSLLELVRDEAPDLITLSITMSWNIEALLAAVRRLRALPLATRPLVGGGGPLYDRLDTLRAQAHFDIYGDDARALTSAALAALVVPRAA